jgi:hypothetical protein
VWQTEWGYSSEWYGSGTSATARGHQARLIVREFLSSWMLGFPFMIYYDVRDDGTNPDDAEHNFGLLANDYGDKPAMVATRALTSRLAGRTLSGILPTLADNLHALKLDGPSDVMLILWTDGRVTWTDTLAADTLTVALASRPSAVADYLGAALPIPVLQGGAYPLSATSEVVYVTFAKNAVAPQQIGQAAVGRGTARTAVFDVQGRRVKPRQPATGVRVYVLPAAIVRTGLANEK